jgi:hypothetical protein
MSQQNRELLPHPLHFRALYVQILHVSHIIVSRHFLSFFLVVVPTNRRFSASVPSRQTQLCTVTFDIHLALFFSFGNVFKSKNWPHEASPLGSPEIPALSKKTSLLVQPDPSFIAFGGKLLLSLPAEMTSFQFRQLCSSVSPPLNKLEALE